MAELSVASKRRGKRLAVFALVALLLATGFYGCHRYYFPYGSQHCCNKALSMMLTEYAAQHGGSFPDAGGSAASLALLADESAPWSLIVGKGGSAEAAESHFRTHGTLPDEFSTWHFVPGLREDSDPRLALFWDTTGLSHAGMRQSPIRYEVCFVDGSCRMIEGSRWSWFLAQQEKLLEEDRKRQAEAK